MKNRSDLSDAICPDRDELKFIPIHDKDDPCLGYYDVNIVDNSWEVFNCVYYGDSCVTIEDDDGHEIISLNKHNLSTLLGYLETTKILMRNER
tara:strand:+ start:215 stop:493 length:279 start_codon:yes stop_codon:yes gene_type:complete